MEGTYLGIEYMSVRKGGRGGAIVNTSSFGGTTRCPYIANVSVDIARNRLDTPLL